MASSRIRSVAIFLTAVALVMQSVYSTVSAHAVTGPLTAPSKLAVRADTNNAYIPNNGYTNHKQVTASWINTTDEAVSYIYKSWKSGHEEWTESHPYQVSTHSTNIPGLEYNLGEGAYSFCVEAVDRDGNKSACSQAYTVNYDTTDPESGVVGNNTDGGVVNTTPILSGVSNEDVRYWIEVKAPDGHKYVWQSLANVYAKSIQWDILSSTFNGSSIPTVAGRLAEGSYSIRYVATDRAGNRSDHLGTPSYESKTFDFSIDTTPPTLNVTPSEGSVLTGEQAIIVETNGVPSLSYIDADGATGELPGSLVEPGKFKFAIDTTKHSKGEFKVAAIARDEVGNEASQVLGYTLDNPGPDIIINTPVIDQTTGLYSVSGLSSAITGSPVTVFLNGVRVASTTTGLKGNWTVGLGELIAGRSYAISVTILNNGYGNTGTAGYSVPPVEVPAPLSSASSVAVTLFSRVITPTSLPVTTDTDDTEVLGTRAAKNPLIDTAAIAASPEGWKFFGIAWYWLLIALATISGLWWLAAARRRVAEDV